MTKRSLGLLLLGIWIVSSGVAHATVTIADDPIAIGAVGIGVPATGSGVLSANPDETVKLELGSGCTEFTMLTGSPLTVGDGGAVTPKTVTFRITATTAGAKSCQVSVRNNGNDQLRLQFNVTATASATPVITLDPTPLPAFPDTDVGATSAGQALRATNTGTAPLLITNATFQTGAADYTLLSGLAIVTLQPGEHTDWSIACHPSTFGTRNGTFRITSNVSGGNTDVALSCTGRQGIAATSVASLDFGQVAQGITKPLTFTLRNDGNATINNLTGMLNDTTRGYVFNAASLPSSLAGSASTTVTVSFAPQSGSDGGPATLTLSGVWGANNTPTSAVVTLAGDGLGVSFSATPGVDFGSFRFDARPQRVYQITNTGEISLSITSATFTPNTTTAANEIAFTINKGTPTVTLPQVLAVGEQLDVKVTAQPNARIGAIGGTVVVHSITPGTADQTVSIVGEVTAAAVAATITVDFGAVDIDGPAQTQMATIMNMGTAVLDIPSFAELNVNPAFTITPPTTPTTLAMGASLSIPVTYRPTVEKREPSLDEGVLSTRVGGVIGVTTAMTAIKGRGIDRHLVVDPDIEVPVAFPNQTNTTPIVITVSNGGEAPLQIMTARVEPATDWKLVDGGVAGGNPIVVGKDGTHDFKVVFTPTTPGQEIAGTLVLETDDDQYRMKVVPLSGVSLFSEAHGGGGCSTSGAGNSGALLLGLAALGLWRPARRRAARRSRASGDGGARARVPAVLTLAAALAAFAFAPLARAEGVELAVFAPTPATTGTSVQLQSPDVGAAGNWVVSSILSYASDPLAVVTRDPRGGSSVREARVNSSSMLQLGGAYAFLGRFEVGARMPLYMQSGTAAASDEKPPADGNALGNLSLHAKLRLWRGGGVVIGASAATVIPTATKEQLTGADQPEVRLLLLGSFAPAPGSRLAITANAGPIVRPESRYNNITQQSGVAWGVGASYRVLRGLWTTAEIFGVATPSGQGPRLGEMTPSTTLSQVEWLAGVTLKADRRFTIGLAAGRGVTDAIGTPDLRGVLSIAFVPGAPAIASIHALEPGKPEVDSDGDGLVDSTDKCPDEPEDKDTFDDGDGCPEPDNDRDTVADAQDRCPLEPEDRDGFEDGDGCPEKDNDGDAVADAKDRCPLEAEDKDGFEDGDGCPEPDNDRDGLADAQDKCPNEPETINGIKDEDGCPDKGDTTIVLAPDRIETLDPIGFTGVKLARGSLPVLAQVGATLRAHGELVRVRITVHVQPSNDPDADQVRSDRRAQAVRDWLVQWGIPPARLETRGFGGSKPLVPADQRGAARINDRVELIILERK